MSTISNIEWTDSTFNPWIGCTKISPACKYCYAEAWAKRYSRDFETRTRTSASNWSQPLKWNRDAAKFFAEHGRRQRVFCASLADVFDNQVDPQWRADLFELITATPNLEWLLLTKRIGNAWPMIRESSWSTGSRWMPDNVWIGATICNQEEAERDIPKLMEIPAKIIFLSIEPMLGPIDLLCASSIGAESLNAMGRIDWVIAGGESGQSARPSHPDWFRSLRDQCDAAGVPFLFKQWGEWVSVSEVEGEGRHYSFPDGATVRRVGKKAAGRSLDGKEYTQFPEFPF